MHFAVAKRQFQCHMRSVLYYVIYSKHSIGKLDHNDELFEI